MTETLTKKQSQPSTSKSSRGKFRVLVADKLAKQGLEWIQSQSDAELVNKPGLSEEELAEIVGEHDAMIVRSGVQVTEKVLENSGRLKVIARAGVGVDNIDLDAATERGILVVNSAEATTTTTAEHAFAMIMALARNIGPAHKTMADGGWDRSKFQGTQLAGKTLGVVGFGRIGRTVAERALAFEMNVVAFDPFINAETAMDGQVRMFQNFEQMLPEVDILSFHVPLNDQTRGLLNAKTFPKARKNLLVVNAARGGVVDEQALADALHNEQIAGAALDVFTEEPLPEDSPLREAPRLLLTPHLGASTSEAQQAVAMDAAGAALTYLRGEGVKGAVNAGGLKLDMSPTQRRYADLASRMALLISPMIDGGIKEVNFEIAGEDISPASETILRMTLAGLLRDHLSTPVNLVNVPHVAEARGISTNTVKRDAHKYGSQLAIEVADAKGQSRRIVGRVYDDQLPRVVEINGYHMDMVPSGHMVLLQNQDRPGIIGAVGNEFGQAEVNIADMTISRRDSTALMVLKVDGQPDSALLDRLKQRSEILKIATIKLPEVH